MVRKGGRIIEGKIDKVLRSGTGTRNEGVVMISSSGLNEVLPTPGSGYKNKIVKLVLVPSGAVTVTLQSGAEGLSGPMALAANAIFTFDGDMNPIEVNENEAFNITLGGAVAVNGFVHFIKEAV